MLGPLAISPRPLTPVAKRRKDYVELERSVEASNELLDSLASYLSTFQHDLSAVSGQVADLQSRSAGIESQLKGRQVGCARQAELTSEHTAHAEHAAQRYRPPACARPDHP